MSDRDLYNFYLKKYGSKHPYVTNLDDGTTILVSDIAVSFSKTSTQDYNYYHRLNGPALIPKKLKYKTQWWINNNMVTDEINDWASKCNIDLDNLSNEDKAYIKLIWSDYGK